jgi:hypothetical protein
MVIERTKWTLDELCGFASRRNSKRGFLFVSKVLGKHYPVRPSRMRAIHAYLAEQLYDLPAPVLFIGMAETAVALGQGVFECSDISGERENLFLHTTRYVSERSQAFSFQESHSHATDHMLYVPDGVEAQNVFSRARSLVVIDDELSTGNTLANLLSAYCDVNPNVRELRAVSITDWLGARRRLQMVERFHPRNLQFINVLQGEFSFIPNPAFDCGPQVNVIGNFECKDKYLAGNYGRFGLVDPLEIDFASLLTTRPRVNERILVLGTGEFMYPPFLVAEWLESRGYDVHFQSTTRSPILLGNDIECAIDTIDNYWDGIPNYLYNVSPVQYDRIYIGYETALRPVEHDMPIRLSADVLEFS